jgi:hypothetical protein
MTTNWFGFFSCAVRRQMGTGLLAVLAGVFFAPTAHAQETVCARVKIEIKQELTLGNNAGQEQWGQTPILFS